MFDGFWDNILRYFKYFVSIILGIFLNAISPLVPLFKRPVTATLLVGVFTGAIFFVVFTLRAMLGLSPLF